jgi:hypothetical protein
MIFVAIIAVRSSAPGFSWSVSHALRHAARMALQSDTRSLSDTGNP